MSLCDVVLAASLLLGAGHGCPASTGKRGYLDVGAMAPVPTLSELEVRGVNHGTGPRTLVIRVDDQERAKYADRSNEERILPPGPFTLRFRLGYLQTPAGRTLMAGNLRYAVADGPDIDVQPLTLKRAGELPPGVHGWYFGPAEAAPLVGFQSVLPGDVRLHGSLTHQQVHRPGTDPVLAYGVLADRFETALPNGKWLISLWVEDPGEWESLPPVLERRIRANGVDLLAVRRTRVDWVNERYLSGRALEADPTQTPFRSLGARRGGRVEGVVDVSGGKLSVELAGYPAAALFVSAITAEPFEPGLARRGAASVEEARAAAFASAWPIVTAPAPMPPSVQAVTIKAVGSAHVAAARGGVAVMRFAASAPAPEVAAASVVWDDAGLDARVLWSMWRWHRIGADGHGLNYAARHMRADQNSVRLRPDLERPVTILFRVPDDSAPGPHRGVLRLTSSAGKTDVAFTVDVLPHDLPPPGQKVGVFLDFAPHLEMDAATQTDARKQAACDMDTLRWLGMTTVAPALEPPDSPTAMGRFISDYRAAAARFGSPLIGYVPFRRMAAQGAADIAALSVARADEAIHAAGLPPLVWTVADEPHGSANVGRLLRTLHAYAPEALLAAHLNSPADRPFVHDMNLVTVNQGYGASPADIEAVRHAGAHPWLYNMGRLRLVAGLYLWRSGAEGLLQWHARMPTADPFDPTDGREADVQFLWPGPTVCGPQDIDEDLISLAEGAEDLRWMTWLTTQASAGNPGAIDLLRDVRAQLGERWEDAARLTDADLILIRTQIQSLSGQQQTK